jgi:ribosomal protein L13
VSAIENKITVFGTTFKERAPENIIADFVKNMLSKISFKIMIELKLIDL